MRRLAAVLLILSVLLASCGDACDCRRGSMTYGTRLNTWTGEWEYCSCERGE